MPIRSINPSTGRTLKDYPEVPVIEILSIIEKADSAQREWRNSTFEARRSSLRKLAGLLRSGSDHHARTIVAEMGKPIHEAQAEVEKCAWVCDFYAEHAEGFLHPSDIKTDTYSSSQVRYLPLGLVLAIMPWNFPFWQIFRAAVPAIAGGNGVIVKPASNVPDSALTIEALFQQAGFPMDLFRVVLTSSEQISVAFVNPKIRAVSLTGSTRAGQVVAAQAASQIKKSVLELGGSDPYIVLEDADLEHAAQTLAAGRLLNCGQSCISVKRVIAMDPIADELEERLAEIFRQTKVGDPLEEATELGPLAREDQRAEIEEQVAGALGQGARLITGGRQVDRHGWFYEPTLLGNIEPGSPVFDEEVFGPVLPVIRAATVEQALWLANQSSYGLGAGVFSEDIERAQGVADEIEAGQVFINDFVKSDPRLPFGGVKQSGYGREMGVFGIREFCNVQTRVVR